MARTTLKAQLEAARLENAQLRQLNAEWAAESARLKREIMRLKNQSSARYPNTEAA